MSSLHCWVVSCRTALEKANVLLSMNHGMAHLDNIWGACGSNRPVKYLTNKVHGNKSVARLINASVIDGGTTAAAPLPFRPRNPALCGSCPLVTPYYCRLGDLLCYNCMLYLFYHFVCMHVYFVFSLFSGLFSFVDFPSVLWYCWLGLLTCKIRLPYNLHCVGGDVIHCTIQSNLRIVTVQWISVLLSSRKVLSSSSNFQVLVLILGSSSSRKLSRTDFW